MALESLVYLVVIQLAGYIAVNYRIILSNILPLEPRFCEFIQTPVAFSLSKKILF